MTSSPRPPFRPVALAFVLVAVVGCSPSAPETGSQNAGGRGSDAGAASGQSGAGVAGGSGGGSSGSTGTGGGAGTIDAAGTGGAGGTAGATGGTGGVMGAAGSGGAAGTAGNGGEGTGGSGGATDSTNEVDVYLLAGQSNATGQGYSNNIPSGFVIDTRVQIYHSSSIVSSGAANTWITLRAASEGTDSCNLGLRFGPELGFGNAIQKFYPNRAACLRIKSISARKGSSISAV